MDFWCPTFLSEIASERRVIIFDPAGVGRSSGEVPSTFKGWADDLCAFVDALGYEEIDLLGFSMGGSVAQMAALTRPELINKLILCGTGPSQPAEPVPGTAWPRETAPREPMARFAAADTEEEMGAAIASAFFPDNWRGRRDAADYLDRILDARDPEQTKEPAFVQLADAETTEKQRMATAEWNKHNPGNSFDRLHELKMKVLIMTGSDDKIVPTSRSWELMKGIEHAQLIVYPQSGHGFMWSYPEKVGHDINDFLNGLKMDFLDDEELA